MREKALRLVRDLKRALGLTPSPIPPSLARYADMKRRDDERRRYVARKSRGNVRLSMGKYCTKKDFEKRRRDFLSQREAD